MIRHLVCLFSVWAAPLHADLSLQFIEGAPKDRFVLTNEAGCPIGETSVTLDLGPSAAGLIFDVTGDGPGVSVFQPFEVTEGRNLLLGLPDLADGDTSLTLDLTGMRGGETVEFTIDVDDTGNAGPTIIRGSEIAGATVTVVSDGQVLISTITDAARAEVPIAACIG